MLDSNDMLSIIKEIILYPLPHVCKHHVAALILSKMEEKGFKCSDNFVKAIVEADDETALKLITYEH